MVTLDLANGILGSLAHNIKTFPMLSKKVLIVKPGKIPPGTSKMDFDFKLEKDSNTNTELNLFETYHGVYINVQVSTYNC